MKNRENKNKKENPEKIEWYKRETTPEALYLVERCGCLLYYNSLAALVHADDLKPVIGFLQVTADAAAQLFTPMTKEQLQAEGYLLCS